MRPTGGCQPQFTSLEALLLEMGRERSVSRLLELIVGRLAARKDVALARLWLVGAGDVCARCPMGEECPDRTSCLHLAASAGGTRGGSRTNWSRLDGAFPRLPLGVHEVGRIAADRRGLSVEEIGTGAGWSDDPQWARGQGIRSFGGEPLTCEDELLGVLAVFTRVRLLRDGEDWLRTIARHAASAIINARAFEEVERLRRKLELENARLREEVRGSSTAPPRSDGDVVSDAEMGRRERENVLSALRRAGWKVYGPGGAADLLGLKPTTLASRMHKMGLRRPGRS